MADSHENPWTRLVRHFRSGDRWLALVAGMWIMSCGGASYTFAIYNPVIKHTLGYNQIQIQSLAVAKDVGASMGLVAGVVCDMFPAWAILTIGALHNLLGFGMVWLVLTGYVSPPPFWQMCLFLLIGSQGAAYFNTTNLVTSVRNFPKSRGSVVGVLKGLVGLSGAIFTQIYTSLVAPDEKDFLLVIAVVPLLITISTMFLVKPVGSKQRKESEEDESAVLNFVIGVCFSLAGYLLATMLIQDLVELPSLVTKAIGLGMLLIFVLPMLAPALSLRLANHRAAAAAAAAATAEAEEKKVKAEAKAEPVIFHNGFPVIHVEEDPLLGQSEDTEAKSLVSFHPSNTANGKPTAGATAPNRGLLKPPLPPHRRPPLNTSDAPSAVPKKAPAPAPSQNYPTFPGSSGGYSSDDFTSGDEEDLPFSAPSSSSASPSSSARLRSPLLGGGAGGSFHPPSSRLERKRSHLLQAVSKGAVKIRRKRSGPRRGEDFTLRQALVKADFWLLFLGFLCGCGSGLAAMNNLAQMGTAQGFRDVGIFVAMASVWNFCGRLGGGFLSEYLIREYCIPRPIVLLLCQACMAVGHLLFALAAPGSLYVGSLIVGMSYGAHWAIMPATASELFGLKHFGILYNTLTIANPLGSYLCSNLIAAYLYEMEANKGSGVGGWFPSFLSSAEKLLFEVKASGALSMSSPLKSHEMATTAINEINKTMETAHTPFIAEVLSSGSLMMLGKSGSECHGAHCFRLTFFIMMGICLLGVLLNAVLVLRTRVVYVSLYGKQMEARNNSRQNVLVGGEILQQNM